MKGLKGLLGISGFELATATAITFPAAPRVLEYVVAQLENQIEVAPKVLTWYRDLCAQESRLIAAKTQELPEALTRSHQGYQRLWPFQKRAVNFALATGKSLLCDEPGLGKTAVAAVATTLGTNPDRWQQILVLCPNSLKMWWFEELARWSPDPENPPRRLIVHAKSREADIAEFLRGPKHAKGYLIMNWDLLRLEYILNVLEWTWVVRRGAQGAKPHGASNSGVPETPEPTQLAHNSNSALKQPDGAMGASTSSSRAGRRLENIQGSLRVRGYLWRLHED